jgi:hypothetical protein
MDTEPVTKDSEYGILRIYTSKMNSGIETKYTVMGKKGFDTEELNSDFREMNANNKEWNTNIKEKCRANEKMTKMLQESFES